MNIALAELAQTEYFNHLKIIAGRNGLWRPIESCGWLDYEFEKILKNRYIYSNFSKNQLVITTFLFAKDNSFLTRDAIRHLIEIDAGGLVVNNVFGLQHSEICRHQGIPRLRSDFTALRHGSIHDFRYRLHQRSCHGRLRR